MYIACIYLRLKTLFCHYWTIFFDTTVAIHILCVSFFIYSFLYIVFVLYFQFLVASFIVVLGPSGSLCTLHTLWLDVVCWHTVIPTFPSGPCGSLGNLWDILPSCVSAHYTSCPVVPRHWTAVVPGALASPTTGGIICGVGGGRRLRGLSRFGGDMASAVFACTDAKAQTTVCPWVPTSVLRPSGPLFHRQIGWDDTLVLPIPGVFASPIATRSVRSEHARALHDGTRSS